ncbi:hypothetical protein DPMN_078717 [Dreissena polymorpha]|uniref:Uncharacterized protein n=2 Tax=Dreissena polymorpha TaxID=45954 RepID=A0A9D3YR41_DREPO|nr:hypothetical protein DPMN_078717 [Dreissena polymorpha]
MTEMAAYQKIVEANRCRRLMSSRHLVRDLLLSCENGQERMRVLLQQVELAKKRPNVEWLRIVARDCDELGAATPRWISDNIHPIHRRVNNPSNMPATQPSKDIRFLETTIPIVAASNVADFGKGEEFMEMSHDEVEALLQSDDEDQGPEKRKSESDPGKEFILEVSPTLRRSPRKRSPTKFHDSRASPLKKPRESHRDERYSKYAARKQPSRDSSRTSSRVGYSGYSEKTRSYHYKRWVSPVDSSKAKRIRPMDKESSRLCCVEGCQQKLTRAHAMAEHVAGIFDEGQQLTPKVTTRRLTALTLCAKWLNHTPDLKALMRFVDLSEDIGKGEVQVGLNFKKSIEDIHTAMDFTGTNPFSLSPMSAPGLLMHWRVQVVICGLLGERRAKELRDAFPAAEPLEWPEAWDSHFHMDRTLARAGLTELSLAAAANLTPGDKSYQVKVIGGVAVFCDPPSYPSLEEVTRLKSQGVISAVGIHPRRAASLSEDDWKAFEKMISLPEITVFGEVGIDHTEDPTHWAQQHVVLDKALGFLRPDQVLVLHNRRAQDKEGDDMLQLLYHLKGVIPREQKIHVHCFTGSIMAVELWIKEFPNVHFGLTKVARSEAERQAVCRIPDDKLLLETDSPYFSSRGQYSCPCHLGGVAAGVSRIRGMDWTDVLTLANTNARRLYNA